MTDPHPELVSIPKGWGDFDKEALEALIEDEDNEGA